MRLVILNGFDRCGSSFIGGLLSRHPQINYFFQPFSRTEVHRTQYEPWGETTSAPATEAFLQSLLAGTVDHDYIASDWFRRFSDFDLGDTRRIGLIKDTKLHTKMAWLKHRFPEVQLYGIRRNPRAILCSLVRNGFHTRWYGEPAYRKTLELLAGDARLATFATVAGTCRSTVEKTALVIAVRTALMTMELDDDQWLAYEQVQEDPDRVLNAFCDRLGLPRYRFSAFARRDYNASGLPFRGAGLWRDYFSDSELAGINRIFERIDHVARAA